MRPSSIMITLGAVLMIFGLVLAFAPAGLGNRDYFYIQFFSWATNYTTISIISGFISLIAGIIIAAVGLATRDNS